MKIKPEHLEYMREHLRKWLAGYPNLPDQYENGDFQRADKVVDLQRRFCFDVMAASGLTFWVCDNLYSYLTDDHIYTALKAILPKVERKY